ncbi:metallophosphoesterase family protein [Evansella cellulosilytica]|uniref:Metallophosphoesterase n=1 Tax=Evansella cellulosilytica (strain ATCC 21833 / DSM 2522 / FERM P-1141 / JCM 9156 / N-4) TaxID=649639 RepID=E6TUG4_EVAC2|nr:DNA repair exonuclease [Evansella cellulosilytica]ADU29720.1 metallophosphoesterase [Evansella cellulosilytica DSM 2522]
MIRFIHCADLHLGRPIKTHADLPASFIKQLQSATYQSFESIVNKAIEFNVDFMLISGDVYDSEHRSYRGQWFLKKQAERLQKVNIPIYVIHGNHDPIKAEHSNNRLPENVHVFSEKFEVVSLLTAKNEKVYLYGFSYPNKAYYDNPIPMYETIGEMSAYHIALLHGQESSQKDHEPYAPFSLNELKQKNIDYWALGHIHKRQILSSNPSVVYPGNIQGAHKKENGEKGAYYVEMTKTDTMLTFLPTSRVQWEHMNISIDECEIMDELLDRIQQISEILDLQKHYLVEVHLTGGGPLHEQLIQDNVQQELMTILRSEVFHSSNVWINSLYVNTTLPIERERLKEKDDLLGDIVRVVDTLEEQHVEEALQPVFSHLVMRKYLECLSQEEIQEIVETAERKILTSLMREVK